MPNDTTHLLSQSLVGKLSRLPGGPRIGVRHPAPNDLSVGGVDLSDELTRGPLVTHQGEIVHEVVKAALAGS